MDHKSEKDKARRDSFTLRVSAILEDPGRLGRLLAALDLNVRHFPRRGCFIGTCPQCGKSDSLYVRYTDTESSTSPIFWTCRNEECKSKWRHSSVLGLVREVLRLR